MGDSQVDFTVSRVRRGSPAVLLFGASEPIWSWETAESLEPSFSLIRLMDSTCAGFYGGVRGLGSSITETAAALREVLGRLEPSEILTCGPGVGGHAALIFGVLLGARRIVAFEPLAHLIPEELLKYRDRRREFLPAELPDSSLARKFEIHSLIKHHQYAGHAFVLFGAGRGIESNDAAHQNLIHAQWLALSDRMSLFPFPEIRQDLWGELGRRGRLEAVLNHYLFDEPVPEPKAVGKSDSTELPASESPFVLQLNRETLADGSEAVYASAANEKSHGTRKFDDEMRRWLAENLLLGQIPDGAARTLRTMGFSARTAIEETARASESPYVRAALRLQNRLKKRDWLLSVYRTLGRLRPESDEIERRMFLSRDEFYRDYYIPNMPVIIEEKADRRSTPRRWSLDDLERRFGDRSVRIRLRPSEVNRDGSLKESETRLLSFRECIVELRLPAPTVDFHLTSEHPENREALSELLDEIEPNPEYLEPEDDPACALRLAPTGSISPFRHELKNGLLTVMMGQLRIKLVPSWDLPMMGNVWENLSGRDGRTLNAGRPNGTGQLGILECIIAPGDLLFLPVGWWYFIEWLKPSVDLVFTNFTLPNEFPPCILPEGKM